MHDIVESLKRQREQVLQSTGDEMLRRHTSLLEIAVISLHNRLVNRMAPDSEKFRAGGAVVALDAFARGLVGPDDTVELLLLRTETLAGYENWKDEIARPLEEAGWKVRFREATVRNILERVPAELPFFFDLLEARYISGNRDLLESLEDALDAFVEEHRGFLIDHLHVSLKERRALLEHPENWLEPNLIKNPGGLEDITSIRALCRIVLGIRCFEDAIFQGFLTRPEVDRLQQAEKLYLRLLSLLHSVAANGSGVLRFHDQERLAEKLGYPARSGFLPVETFMKDVYQHFHDVHGVSAEFCERLQDSGRFAVEGGEEKPSFPLEEGLEVQSGKIVVHPSRYPASAGAVVHLFVAAAKHRIGFASSTRQWIRHHSNLVETAAGDPKARDEFLELVRCDSPELPVIRRFYNYGLLQGIIPESASVHGLVQHDAFHIYPVHEHHLRTLSVIKRLLQGDYEDSEPELTEMARSVSDPTCLYLAALLHDVGKSAGRDHALHGGEMIPSIARRLGLEPEWSDMVQFLVAQHLLLIDTAAMRDLADQEMLTQCALLIGDPERLQLLLLLSFADMNATGPKAEEKWRETPVRELYDRLLYILEKGEPSDQSIADRLQRIKAQVQREVQDLVTPEELEDHFSQLPPRYLLAMPPEAVGRHLRMELELNRSGEVPVWEVQTSDGTAEITLMSPEMPGLVANTAGIFTLHDLDIRGAQVFTKKNGMVLLIFRCRMREGAGITCDWKALRDDMKRLLQGRLALDYRIAAHAAQQGPSARSVPSTPSQVLIDNESTRYYTILEVYSTDRPGLLYTITRTLMDLQVRIFVAKITTKVDQVADIFYIKTHEGKKVTDPEQMEEIRRALIFWLDGPASDRDAPH
ncbi:HD domain-containing protein [Desulfoglaeba alkanexedens]|uniref:Bifunctional uridylyltransferase/uridylyl-removing enzyme n=1 Tax=Desulfoglaeba alkanexedens ALDC TaxID=980445 RepID=A0A4P8L1Y0_9BACT|nr:HD domain-containing protein [Desulfoglaeba alkanexedens]QCQ21878.1 HD domain-containing protein [Desulfoglaeba alkanexedens ALDC]